VGVALINRRPLCIKDGMWGSVAHKGGDLEGVQVKESNELSGPESVSSPSTISRNIL